MATKNSTTFRRSASELQLGIARDVLDRIERRELKSGDHIREREITEKFEISRTPVRAALQILVDQGVLEKRDNMGFFVCADADAVLNPLPTDEIQDIYDHAARDWFQSKAPQQFTDSDFRARYGLNRLVAGRVLNRLARDGIVVQRAGQGWSFPPTLNTRKAHDDSYRFRLIVEPAGILTPSFAMSPDRLQQLRRRVETGVSDDRDASAHYAVDALFHSEIAKASGNQFVAEAVERQNRLRRLLEYVSLVETRRLHESAAEHIDILDALEAENRPFAAELMADHLRASSRHPPNLES